MGAFLVADIMSKDKLKMQLVWMVWKAFKFYFQFFPGIHVLVTELHFNKENN